MSEPTPAIPHDITAGANNTNITKFVGFSIYEDAGAASHWTFRHGASDGVILASVKLASGESAMIMLPRAIATPLGVYVVEVAGSNTGTMFNAGPPIS